MSDRELFFTLLDVPVTERVPFLQQKAEDEGQRQRVEELLNAHLAAGGFLADQNRSPSKTEPASPLLDHAGQIIAQRYKLLEPLGEGGMGTVWKAEQLEPVRRLVAIKLIKRGMDSKQVIARFDAERQALAMMDHPNIARIHDGGAMSDGRPYFVMELVAGIPLTRYCDEKKLTITSRLQLFTQICQAVQHAHQKGILHRDLKPGNLMVTEHDGQPILKVIDFGLAKAIQPSMMLTDQTLNTSAGTVVGTPLYMAPEQVERNALDIDTRADIYALGVILYELLTGTTPLERERLRTAAWDEVKRLIREEEPPKPSTRLSSTEGLPSIASQRDMEPARLGRFLRGDLDWIVMKTLEKDRDRRYASANALAEDVNRFLNHEPVSAGPPSAAYKIQKFVRRHRGGVLAATVMLLLLIAGTIGTTWGMLTAQQQRDRAVDAEKDVRQQKELVEQEANKSNAVIEFLQKDLFEQANLHHQPKEAGERAADLKVRTLLDRASVKMEGKFEKSPSTEIILRYTIGDVYLRLGLYPEAEKHLLRALELSEKHMAAGDSKIATVRASLAYLRERQGQFSESSKLYDSANETMKRLEGSDNPETFTQLLNTAKLLNEQRKDKEAEKLTREVLTHSSKLKPMTLAMAQHELATALWKQGQLKEAESYFRLALESRLKELGPDHPHVLANQNNLALVLMEQGQLKEAEALFRKSQVHLDAKLGKDHPDNLQARSNFAVVLQKEGKLEEAAAMMAEVLKQKIAKFGPDHPNTLSTRHNLACVYQAQKKNAEAEKLLVENVPYCEKKFGKTNPNTMTVKYVLAVVLSDLEKYAQAESLYRECLAVKAQGQFRDKPMLQFEASLGFTLSRQGKLDEAEKLFLSAFEQLNSWSDRETVQYYQSRLPQWLRELYEAKKQPEEVAKWKAVEARLKPPVPPAK
ncbi:MAG TPA: serine/threonine-protein kinase [Gemmatales bacterium]|nr:serine/threonine-protein kinase [Gemmatales bacterium]